MRNKVQTNDYQVNVLVECENSNSQHWSHLDFDVKIIKVFTNQELLDLVKQLPEANLVSAVKDWLKTKPGFAISSVESKDKSIIYNSLVEYTSK